MVEILEGSCKRKRNFLDQSDGDKVDSMIIMHFWMVPTLRLPNQPLNWVVKLP